MCVVLAVEHVSVRSVPALAMIEVAQKLSTYAKEVIGNAVPIADPRNTHRGARAHDHKVKGLALCRLS